MPSRGRSSGREYRISSAFGVRVAQCDVSNRQAGSSVFLQVNSVPTAAFAFSVGMTLFWMMWWPTALVLPPLSDEIQYINPLFPFGSTTQ